MAGSLPVGGTGSSLGRNGPDPAQSTRPKTRNSHGAYTADGARGAAGSNPGAPVRAPSKPSPNHHSNIALLMIGTNEVNGKYRRCGRTEPDGQAA